MKHLILCGVLFHVSKKGGSDGVRDDSLRFYVNKMVIIASVAYQGGVGVFKPPRNSEGPPKNRAKLNPIVKTVKKLLNLGHQHTKMFRKKAVKF